MPSNNATILIDASAFNDFIKRRLDEKKAKGETLDEATKLNDILRVDWSHIRGGKNDTQYVSIQLNTASGWTAFNLSLKNEKQGAGIPPLLADDVNAKNAEQAGKGRKPVTARNRMPNLTLFKYPNMKQDPATGLYTLVDKAAPSELFLAIETLSNFFRLQVAAKKRAGEIVDDASEAGPGRILVPSTKVVTPIQTTLKVDRRELDNPLARIKIRTDDKNNTVSAPIYDRRQEYREGEKVKYMPLTVDHHGKTGPVNAENIHLAIPAGTEITSGMVNVVVCMSNMGISFVAELKLAVVTQVEGHAVSLDDLESAADVNVLMGLHIASAPAAGQPPAADQPPAAALDDDLSELAV